MYHPENYTKQFAPDEYAFPKGKLLSQMLYVGNIYLQFDISPLNILNVVNFHPL